MNEAVPQPSARPTVGRARQARTVVGVVIAVGCVVFLGRHLWVWREEVGHAFALQPSTLALLTFFVFLAHVQRAVEFNYMLRRLSAQESLGDSFLLTGVALLLNNFPFSAGSAARAVALQKKHNLHYASYLSALIISALVNAQMAAALGFAMSLAVLPPGGPRDSLATLFGAAALAGTAAVLAPTTYLPAGETFFAKNGRRLLEGLRLIRGRGGLLVLIATSAAKLVFNTLRLWLCFRAMGLDLPADYVALLGSAAVMISVVNLVPGNIGLRELLVGALSGAMGFSPTLGMAAATIDRAIILCYTFAVGLPCMLAIRRAFSQ